jgi:hypothetical protein
MNVVELQKKLIAAARANPPGQGVPYAFERRVMARLAGERLADRWALWARALWRVALPCLATAVALSIWTYTSGAGRGPEISLARDLESTVYAVVDAPAETR